MHPTVGTRLRVYWVGERKWYRGVVAKCTTEADKKIHHIVYDDGDSKWHDLAEEIWLELAASSKAKAAPEPPKPSKRPATEKPADAAPPARKKKVAAKAAGGKAKPASAAAAQPAAAASSSSQRASSPLPPQPPLVSVCEGNVDVFPCGVIRVRNAVPFEARQRLWDTVMCAGFDFREVVTNGNNRNGANMWYTQAAGAPDILLHFNYYEAPTAVQPPPMALLCAADAVFRAAAKLEAVQVALEPIEAGEEDEEGEEGEGTEDCGASNGVAEHRGEAHDDAPSACAAGPSCGDQSPAASSVGVSVCADAEGSASTAKSERPSAAAPKAAWVDEAAADATALAEAVAKQAENEQRALLWPRRPNFRSVLAIGYRPTDTFRWHTDLAGEDGWVCSLSVGATSMFEYLPTAAPSALRRARARADGEGVVRIEVGSGDALLFHGGLLAHRVSTVDASPTASQLAGCHLDPYVRLNLQVRVFGTGLDFGLQELLKKGFDYVN